MTKTPILLSALLLAACTTTQPPARPAAATAPKRHTAAKPAQAAPAPATPAQPAGNAAPGDDQSAVPAANAPPGGTGVPAAPEWQQLAPYRKNAFDIFTLTETQAGLTPLPGAVGVYTVAATKADRLRLRLAPRPDSPVHLASGAYAVQLQMELTYTEQRACRGAACHGEVEEISRKASKSVRLLLAPQVHYVAETTLPLAAGKSLTDDEVSYTGVTLKVRRLTIAPARKAGK